MKKINLKFINNEQKLTRQQMKNIIGGQVMEDCTVGYIECTIDHRYSTIGVRGVNVDCSAQAALDIECATMYGEGATILRCTCEYE